MSAPTSPVATSTTTSPDAGVRVGQHAAYWPAVLALTVGGFTIGTTEFVTMGLIPQISHGVGVSIPTGGHIISAYALGVVVGAPVLAYFAARLPRRGLLVTLMVVYAVFNVASAAAQGFGMLTAARFLDGLPHGAYFGVASLVAASMAAEGRKGRAVATVMLGLSVANVLGVPAATWMGQHLGWRSAYLGVGVLALLTAVLVRVFVPAVPGDPEASGRRELVAFRKPQVWLTLLAGAIGFGGMFAVYSYIAPTVTKVGGLDDGTVPIFLLAFGLGMVAGTWVAGELADWSVFGSLVLGAAGMGLSLLVFWWAAPHGWLMLPVAFVVTTLSSILVINLQLRLMDVAGDAQTIGAALNHASLNIANAVGAWLGGVVISAGAGYRAPALVGAALSAGGLVVVLVAGAAQRRTDSRSASHSVATTS